MLDNVPLVVTILMFVEPKLNVIKYSYHNPVIFPSYITLTYRTRVEHDIVKTNYIPAPCSKTCLKNNRESVGVDGSEVYVLVNPSAGSIAKSG